MVSRSRWAVVAFLCAWAFVVEANGQERATIAAPRSVQINLTPEAPFDDDLTELFGLKLEALPNAQAMLFLPEWYSGFYELRTRPEVLPSERYSKIGQGHMVESGRRLALLYGYSYIVWARERARILAGEDPLVASLVTTTLTAIGTGSLYAAGGDMNERFYLSSRLTIQGVRFGFSLATDLEAGFWQGMVKMDVSTLIERMAGKDSRMATSVARRAFWTPGNEFLFTAAPWGAYGELQPDRGLPH